MIPADTFRNMISHRVTFEYEDGTKIIGYLSACRPAQGTVHILELSRAEIISPQGNLLEQHRQFSLVPSVLVNLRIAEGPSA